jgi:hypothetical protein
VEELFTVTARASCGDLVQVICAAYDDGLAALRFYETMVAATNASPFAASVQMTWGGALVIGHYVLPQTRH